MSRGRGSRGERGVMAIETQLADRFPKLVTIAHAAGLIGRQKKTLQNWIYTGQLRGDNGLCYVGPRDHQRPMIDLALFATHFIKRSLG
jgi:hypothetical protein